MVMLLFLVFSLSSGQSCDKSFNATARLLENGRIGIEFSVQLGDSYYNKSRSIEVYAIAQDNAVSKLYSQWFKFSLGKATGSIVFRPNLGAGEYTLRLQVFCGKEQCYPCNDTNQIKLSSSGQEQRIALYIAATSLILTAIALAKRRHNG